MIAAKGEGGAAPAWAKTDTSGVRMRSARSDGSNANNFETPDPSTRCTAQE